MNKIVFFLIMISGVLASGQESLSVEIPTIQYLIYEYEAHCNEVVNDTVMQHGVVQWNFKKRDDGLYQMVPDTTWKEVSCPEYKHDVRISAPSWWYIETDVGLATTSSGELKGTEKGHGYKESISRDYICECKRRRVSKWSEHFWDWIKSEK